MDQSTDGAGEQKEKKLAGMEQIEADRRAAGVDELFSTVLEIKQSPSAHVQISSKLSPPESFVLLAIAAFELIRNVSRQDSQEMLAGFLKAASSPKQAESRIIMPQAVGMEKTRPS